MKFNENRSKGSGDIKQTQNSRVNPMSFTCELESRYLGHVLCTQSN